MLCIPPSFASSYTLYSIRMFFVFIIHISYGTHIMSENVSKPEISARLMGHRIAFSGSILMFTKLKFQFRVARALEQARGGHTNGTLNKTRRTHTRRSAQTQLCCCLCIPASVYVSSSIILFRLAWHGIDIDTIGIGHTMAQQLWALAIRRARDGQWVRFFHSSSLSLSRFFFCCSVSCVYTTVVYIHCLMCLWCL